MEDATEENLWRHEAHAVECVGKFMTSSDTKHLLKQLIERLQNTTMYDSTQLFLVLTALLIFWQHTPGGMDDRPVEGSVVLYIRKCRMAESNWVENIYYDTWLLSARSRMSTLWHCEKKFDRFNQLIFRGHMIYEPVWTKPVYSLEHFYLPATHNTLFWTTSLYCFLTQYYSFSFSNAYTWRVFDRWSLLCAKPQTVN